MERGRAERHHDHLIAQLATRQQGVVARFQLLALGIPPGAIDTRLRRGALHRLHRGVYAVGHLAVGIHGRRIAAVLALGDGAVLSHRSAGAAWRVRADAGTRFDVTVGPEAGRRPRAGFRVHRMAIEPFEITMDDGLALTTPARTLLDLAEVLPAQAVGRAIEAAEGLRLFDLAAVERVIGAHPARHGARRLRRLLSPYEFQGLTRSELEERVLALCARFGVPRPLVNAHVADLEVDFYWPEAQLVVEADSRRHHDTRAAFERDRERDARLLLHGVRVLRLTHRRIVNAPEEVGGTLLALTRARRVLDPSERERAER
jgi:very-short-patch-repair endonuclease